MQPTTNNWVHQGSPYLESPQNVHIGTDRRFWAVLPPNSHIVDVFILKHPGRGQEGCVCQFRGAGTRANNLSVSHLGTRFWEITYVLVPHYVAEIDAL